MRAKLALLLAVPALTEKKQDWERTGNALASTALGLMAHAQYLQRLTGLYESRHGWPRKFDMNPIVVG